MNGPEQIQDSFEQQLTRAMRRVEPPAHLAGTVMQRAAGEIRPPARVVAVPSRWRTLQMWAAGAVAAMVIAGAGVQHVHRRRERAEATRQFEVATQIEQQALEHTREQIERAGVSLEPQ